MVTTPTSGPQIQDFKVRNAIDQLTTGLNTIEARELFSTSATACSTVTIAGSPTTGTSLASSATSIVAIGQAVIDIVAALRTAKLMR